MNGRNKRWREQRWDERQPDRLEHIRQKKMEKEKLMNDKNKPFVHVQFGDDGNPEIKAAGSAGEQSALCIALMAGLTMMYGTESLAEYLTFLLMGATELVERMEEQNDED